MLRSFPVFIFFISCLSVNIFADQVAPTLVHSITGKLFESPEKTCDRIKNEVVLKFNKSTGLSVSVKACELTDDGLFHDVLRVTLDLPSYEICEKQVYRVVPMDDPGIGNGNFRDLVTKLINAFHFKILTKGDRGLLPKRFPIGRNQYAVGMPVCE